MFTYKNTTDQPITLPNLGLVQPGKTITSPVELIHPDLEAVSSKKDDKSDKEETKQSS